MFRLLACLLLTACAAPEPHVSPIVGPDGTRAFYVSCAGSEARCFQLAGESCPLGYNYAPTPRGNLLVRCKDLMAPSPYAAFSDHAQPIIENPFSEASLAPNPYTSSGDAGLAPNPYSKPNPYTAPTTPPAAPAPAGSASFPPLN